MAAAAKDAKTAPAAAAAAPAKPTKLVPVAKAADLKDKPELVSKLLLQWENNEGTEAEWQKYITENKAAVADAVLEHFESAPADVSVSGDIVHLMHVFTHLSPAAVAPLLLKSNLTTKPLIDSAVKWSWQKVGSTVTYGPISKEELKKEWETKKITGENKVWHDGMKSWDHIKNVLSLNRYLSGAVATKRRVSTAPALDSKVMNDEQLLVWRLQILSAAVSPATAAIPGIDLKASVEVKDRQSLMAELLNLLPEYRSDVQALIAQNLFNLETIDPEAGLLLTESGGHANGGMFAKVVVVLFGAKDTSTLAPAAEFVDATVKKTGSNFFDAADIDQLQTSLWRVVAATKDDQVFLQSVVTIQSIVKAAAAEYTDAKFLTHLAELKARCVGLAQSKKNDDLVVTLATEITADVDALLKDAKWIGKQRPPSPKVSKVAAKAAAAASTADQKSGAKNVKTAAATTTKAPAFKGDAKAPAAAGKAGAAAKKTADPKAAAAAAAAAQKAAEAAAKAAAEAAAKAAAAAVAKLDLPFDSDDFNQLSLAAAAGDASTLNSGDLIDKLEKFTKAMNAGDGTEEEWKAAVEADDFQLPAILGMILVNIKLSASEQLALVNNISIIASINPEEVSARLSTVRGFLLAYSQHIKTAARLPPEREEAARGNWQLDSEKDPELLKVERTEREKKAERLKLREAAELAASIFEARLQFFLNVCLAAPDATAESKVVGIEEITAKWMEFVVFEDSAFAVEAAGATLVLLNIIDPEKTVLHAAAEVKRESRQALMDSAYKLINRAEHDAKVALTEAQRQKLEWASLVWVQNVVEEHAQYFYKSDVQVLVDVLIQRSQNGGVDVMLPEYLKTLGALCAWADYPPDRNDEKKLHKEIELNNFYVDLSASVRSVVPATELTESLQEQIGVLAAAWDEVVANNAAKYS